MDRAIVRTGSVLAAWVALVIVFGSAAWACVPTGGARALTLNPAHAKPGGCHRHHR